MSNYPIRQVGFTILIHFLQLEEFVIIKYNLFIETLEEILNEILLQYEANDTFCIPSHTL